MKHFSQLSLFAYLSCLLVPTRALFPIGSRQTWKVGQGVQTSSGLILGHPASHRSDVSEYLGIPFAKPPVGDLRWVAPQEFAGKGTINASSFSPDCPATVQQLGNFPGLAGPNAVRILTALSQSGDNFSEDCLTLNIWTKPQSGEKSKAVLLWIYGGAFSIGNTKNPIYDGEYLAANEDVVLVSVNYRVNIFGFPGLPGYDQNVGLQDQRLAIEWVQKNIAAFGGDPTRITIFGQSAGGASVDYYSYAWVKDPIVAGFIEESGTATSFSYSGASNNNTGAWYNASEALGCGGPTTPIPNTLSCMRTKDFQSVLRASANGSFAPTVDNKIIFGDYPARAAAGNFVKKPYLIGNTDYEAGVFKIALPLSDAEWEYEDLLSFTCPAALSANARSASGVPTWRYRWFGDFPNLRLTINPDSRAWHGSELPIVFGTAVDVSGAPDTLAEAAITAYVQGAWATFAKNPTSGLSNFPFCWPKYSNLTTSLVRLAYDNQTTASYVTAGTYDSGCASVGISI